MDQSKKMASIAYEALESKKGEDIKVIDISEISVVADYFVIATGTNASQVDTLVRAVEDSLSEKGIEPKRIEGTKTASWILMDYGDIIIHIFSEEDRLFYNLEKMWTNGKLIDKDLLK